MNGIDGFATALSNLRASPETLSNMRRAARLAAEPFSWDAVFEKVHGNYDVCFKAGDPVQDAAPSRHSYPPAYLR